MLAEAADDSIRVIVLAGSGGSFSAGLDRPDETLASHAGGYAITARSTRLRGGDHPAA